MEPTIKDLNAKINSQLLALESKIKAPDPEKSIDLRSSSVSKVVDSLRNTKNNFKNLSLRSTSQSKIYPLVRPRQSIIPIVHHHSIQNYVYMVPRPSIVAVVPHRFLTDATDIESSQRTRTPIMIKNQYAQPDFLQKVPILKILKKKKEQLTHQFSIFNMATYTTDIPNTNNDLTSPNYTQDKNEIKKGSFPPVTAQIKQLIKRQLMESPLKLQCKKKPKSVIMDELEDQEPEPEAKNEQICLHQQIRKVSDSEQDMVSMPTKSTVVSPSNTAKKQISFANNRRSSMQVQQITTKKKVKSKKETQQVKELKQQKQKKKEQNLTINLQERLKQRLIESNVIKEQSLSQTKVVYAEYILNYMNSLTLKRRGTTFMKHG